jgi:ubiquinone/menaquinone biosynthesis C-methylase UbiE
MPFLQSCARSGKNLLEIGCGIGMDLTELTKLGCSCTGVDLSPESIKIARKHFEMEGLHADFKVENAEELHFPDASFDVVYSFGVLHHTPDTHKALDEVYRILRPMGTAYIMLYSRYSLNNLIHVIFHIPYESPRNRKIDAPVTRCYSKKELKKKFSSFNKVNIQKRYLFGAGWRPISDIVPQFINDALGRFAGWHWLIRAQKAA